MALYGTLRHRLKPKLPISETQRPEKFRDSNSCEAAVQQRSCMSGVLRGSTRGPHKVAKPPQDMAALPGRNRLFGLFFKLF